MARCRGVYPDLSFALGSAPAASRAVTTSAWLFLAASCSGLVQRGVSLVGLVAWTFPQQSPDEEETHQPHHTNEDDQKFHCRVTQTRLLRLYVNSVNGDRAVQSHSSARLKVIASNGRMLTGASSWALAMSSHCPSSSSKASRVRSTGSMSHRCATPAPA